MVGSLALHTDNDHEDSDFFDQLENEFGDGDLKHLHSGIQKEEKDRLDDAFSKLILGEEDCDPDAAPPSGPAHLTADAPASSLIAEHIDGTDSTACDSWLKENNIDGTAVENESGILAHAVYSSNVDAPLAVTDGLQSSPNVHPNPDFCNESSIVEPPNAISTESTIQRTTIEDPVETVTVCNLELSGSNDVCTPESCILERSTDFPSCTLSDEIPELNLTAFDENARKLAASSTVVENVSGLFSDAVPNAAEDCPHVEASTANSLDVSSNCTSSEPGNAHSVPTVDVVGGTESPGVKELQWSSFGNSYIPDTFGSYSDFFTELGSETLVDSNQETTAQVGGYQVESLMNLSSTVLNGQGNLGVEGESFGLGAASGFYGSSAEHFDETAYWNQQGVLNYGINEQDSSSSRNVVAFSSELHQALDSKQFGMSSDAVSETGSANYSSRTANYDAQPLDEAQQILCPGWYFDYTSNEWRQKEGWSAVQEQPSFGEEGNLSFLQPLESSQQASMASNSFWQSNQGQDLLGSNESFTAGTLAGSDVQQFANGSLPEQQYPGWYYDYQTQQWCQVADNGQSWASNQDLKLEASQGMESVQNVEFPGGGLIGQQVQPHYPSEVNQNQNVYLPETSHSVYSSSGGNGTSTLMRGMSFNSWTEPTMGGSVFGQQGMDNTNQGGSVNSWTGFQGGESTLLSHSYQTVPNSITQSQHGFSLADKSAFLGNSHGFLQSHTPSSVVGVERSSAGRPPHALVAFGFGGKLVTMKDPQLGNAEPIVLHDLNHLVSSVECKNDVSTYFCALNRQGLSGPLHGATSKDVLKWVDERIENCEQEDSQGLNSEGLRLLWGVLKIACQHYGKLRSASGSAGIKSQMEDGPETALGRLLTSAQSQSHWNQGLSASMDVAHTFPTGHMLQAAVNEVRNLLMDGRRKDALQYAQQGQLWGLALVLAWQLGEKIYADTVLRMAQQQFSPGSPMRTLLLLFAGQASELFKVQSSPFSAGTYGPFPSAASTTQDSAGGMLRDWLGNLSIIAANPTKGDEQVITHLGDSLWKDQGEVAGAHTCYLVADTSFEPFSKEARLCLVGADHFKFQRTFATPQAIQRTELYEYAKTIGNPQYVLVPFQPFKLLYAHMLAEAGRITEATRYCQIVLKNLKSAGRGPEIEFCKQSAVALEERLRLHSQGGYSLNFSTGKLVGKVMGTIDSTIHKIIGGPPLAQQAIPAFGNPQDWYPNDGNATSATKAAPLIPSASNNNLFSVNSQVDVPTRSISEPNLVRSSSQEPSARTTLETSSASPNQLKSAGSGYLGRFGSQIFAKAIGFVRPNKEAKLGDENKFYYDEKLKRWVEAGAEQSTEEAVLAPPPMVASFNSSSGSPSDVKSGGESQGQSAGVSSSADLPPMPPSINQFSARGRLHGVRSRYVDTFNKGNAQVAAKPSQLPVVPTAGAGWGVAASPSQFFASTPLPAVTNGSSDMLANGHNSAGSAEFLKPASDSGHSQVENEPFLPKNLNTSFMDVPVIQKHSGVDNNMAMLSDNDHTPAKTDASALGNMARAVSWSGGLPNTFTQGKLSNGSIAEVQTKALVNAAAASILPPPPILEPPSSYAGYESGQMQAVAAEGMLSGSLQGATLGEMQEVEL